MADTDSSLVDDRRATQPEGGEAIHRPKAKSLKPLALLLPYVL